MFAGIERKEDLWYHKRVELADRKSRAKSCAATGSRNEGKVRAFMGEKRGKIIPMKKSKKVIRLEDRGRERKLVKGAWFFGILAALCLAYCAGIGLFLGYGTYFFLIWGVMGAGFGIIALLCAKPAIRRRIPAVLIKSFWVCFGIGVAIFVLVEGLILSRCSAKGTEGADYVIVLGAQWKTSGPSKVLKYRLDEAAYYLRRNPDAKVIVSGGKGPGEPISEAEGMAGYLEHAGVDREKILVENTSVNTYENLRNSALFLDKNEDSVVIITNNFHVFRAERLARGQGYKKVTGVAAASYPPMQIHNLLREFCGVMKDFLMGNLVYWERE